ncbi:hypothetical protein N7468_010572, partial [Penicillium chermesinum]
PPPETTEDTGILGGESTPPVYDWSAPNLVHSTPFGFSTNLDHPLGPGPAGIPNEPTEDQFSNAKVPIPRSANPNVWTSSGRTSRACENCREQKAKCSGHRPVCTRCKDSGLQCIYSYRKREKMVKQVEDLTAQVHSYENVLREIYPKLDTLSGQFVDRMLGDQLVRISHSAAFSEDGSSTAHPLAAMDHTEEDFNRDEKVQALGFVGEHAEITWLYRLKRDLDQESSTPSGETLDRPSISSLNYFLGEMELLCFDEIELTGRPPQTIADQFVEAYFETVHPAFPIIGKSVFLGQYRSFYSNPNLQPGKRWMAVLNLVFAIGARNFFLLNGPLAEPADKPVVFFTRAWRLSLENVALFDHPNLQQTQVEGLAAFFLLATGQVNRSWRIIGIAIRSAVAMGLNLRSQSDSIPYVSKETRYRVWWALFTLDIVLSVMTGRPPSVGKTFCTTPLPVPYRDEDFPDEAVKQLITDHGLRNTLLRSLLSDDNIPGLNEATMDRSPGPSQTSGLGSQEGPSNQIKLEALTPSMTFYFLYAVDLGLLMRRAIEALYAPGATRRTWKEIENAISTFNDQADQWLSRLPAQFNFARLSINHPLALQRARLAFQFFTTKLVITQPCLRHLAYQPVGSPASGHQCDAMATVCVQTAKQMLSIFPDAFDASFLYRICPWWCILHYIVQSLTILLIELFTRSHPGTIESLGLAKDIRRAMHWLREMAARDSSSHQAFSVFRDILARHGPRFALNVD